MVRLLPRRRKSNKAQSKEKQVQQKDDEDGSTSTVSSSTFYPHRYPENVVNNSLVAQFAQMSATIAATLTNEEFGTHENNLYRRNAKYDSRIIHPVECKRDIFVESVTPFKKKNRIKNRTSNSIYQVNVGRERSPYIESNDVHNDQKSTSKIRLLKEGKLEGTDDGSDSGKETVPCNSSNEDCDSGILLTSSSSSSGDKEKTDNDKNSNLCGQSGLVVVRTRKFANGSNRKLGGKIRSSHNLRVETKTFPTAVNEISQLNSDGLYKEHPRVSRSTTMEISPSSTVSSLTLPAEIDFMFTPREVIHPTKMPIITEDDSKLSEI